MMTQYISDAAIEGYFANLRKSGKRNRQLLINRMTKHFRIFENLSIANFKHDELRNYLRNWKEKSYKVNVFDDDSMEEWIHVNLVGLWHMQKGSYFFKNIPDIYYFENEKDALAFKMRWG